MMAQADTPAVRQEPPRSARARGWIATVTPLEFVVTTLLCLIVGAALIGPFIAPASIYDSDIMKSLEPPSAKYWLGTDDQGRDVFWRIVAGSRESLLSAMLIVAGYSSVGVLVATIAAVGGRWVDEALMRITDTVLALPSMLVALGFAAALGPSLRSAIIAMILVGWPATARLLRGIMRETMAMPYVDSARVLGVSRFRLMVHHVLPNSLDVLIVKWAADIGFTILVLGGLSFIGVGAQPPSAEWGAMVTQAKAYITSAWWAALFPGFAIALTATVFGLFGEILQVRRNPMLRDA
ncbi:MAG: ABC transporter permease [Chloroflexota bacterium]